MMVKAKGPVWHKKQKEQGIIPDGLTGIDREATWCTSNADGWIYGHGTFSMVSHKIPVLGCFLWMRNSANEAKRLWLEAGHYSKILDAVVMDSKADDYALFREFKKQHNINLVTSCRKNRVKNYKRKQMFRIMNLPKYRKYFKERCKTVEPMQGIVKEVFDLDRCWMRGDENNRWIFAAMGLVVQMYQLQAYRINKSTWKIKSLVIGEG